MTGASEPPRRGGEPSEPGATAAGSVPADSRWSSWSVQLPSTNGTYVPHMEQIRAELNGPEGVDWQLGYDQASIEKFAAEVEAERARLLHEIDVARSRAAMARGSAATQQSSAQAELGSIVLAAQAELSQIEREHHEVVSAIRATAEAEAARVLAAARAEASAVLQAATSMAALVQGSEPKDEPRLVDLDEADFPHTPDANRDTARLDPHERTAQSGARAWSDAG